MIDMTTSVSIHPHSHRYYTAVSVVANTTTATSSRKGTKVTNNDDTETKDPLKKNHTARLIML